MVTACAQNNNYVSDVENQRKSEYSKKKISETLLIDATKLASDLRALSHDSLQGRLPGSQGSVMAQKYIIKRMQEFNVGNFNNSYLQKFPLGKVEGSNIVGIIPGSKFPDSCIVISAHYDHLGIKNDKIYNGADDNASGVCGLLAMLEYFSKNKPENSLIFCFFDAEESGLKGAKHFVDNLPVKQSVVKMNMNLDMISRNDKHDEIIICGTNFNPQLRKALEPLSASTNAAIIFGYDRDFIGNKLEDWTSGSDHYVFHKKGIPFLYFGVEEHPDYHGPDDDFEKIDTKFYASVVNLITRAVIVFDIKN